MFTLSLNHFHVFKTILGLVWSLFLKQFFSPLKINNGAIDIWLFLSIQISNHVCYDLPIRI